MRSRGVVGVGFAFVIGSAGVACSTGGSGGEDDDDPGPTADAPAAPDSAPGVDGYVPTADAPAAANEPEGLVGITQAHNDVRAAHGVAPLVWDPALAAIAQAWANQCVDTAAPAGLVDANANRSVGYPEYVGENIYGATGPSLVAMIVSYWASQEANYNYASNTCTGNCGAYTQVVWAGSTKLGCGISTCPGLTYGYTVVCDYAPGGNDGNRPY